MAEYTHGEVKTKMGWDENSIIIGELAEALQDVGIAALTIHGTTRGVQKLPCQS